MMLKFGVDFRLGTPRVLRGLAVVCSVTFAQSATSAWAEGCGGSMEGSCNALGVTEFYGADFGPPPPGSSSAVAGTTIATSPPVLLSPSGDDGLSLRTSFARWRDYNAQVTAEKIAAARDLAGSTLLPVPKSTNAPTALDVWSNIDVTLPETNADSGKRVELGADYKLSRKATAGVAAEVSNSESTGSTLRQDSSKVSAHVAVEVSPLMSINTRTEWEVSDEKSVEGGEASDRKSLIIEPRVGKSFALDNGGTIQPYVGFKQEFDLDPGALSESKASETAGAGITVTEPDAYSLNLSTNVEGLGGDVPSNLNSKIQLNVPLNSP